MKYALRRRRTLSSAPPGSQIDGMPASSACVRCTMGGNVKTATAIFHARMTKAAYL